jgi:hypothetical protein
MMIAEVSILAISPYFAMDFGLDKNVPKVAHPFSNNKKKYAIND